MSTSFISAVPVLALGLIVLAFVGYVELDLARADGVRHLPKWLWAVICAVSVPLGGILYLAIGRPLVTGDAGVSNPNGEES